MTHKFLLGLLLIFGCAFSWAQSEFVLVPIKYISAENVYLDGGKAKGLAAGDTVWVLRDNRQIAILLATYVADYSAACRIVEQQSAPGKNDMAKFIKRTAAPEKLKPLTVTPGLPGPGTAAGKKSSSSSRQTRVTGNIAAQWYRAEDRSSTRYLYNQPGARLNLRVRNLLAPNYNLDIKVRSRYNDRSYRLNTGVPEKEWQNRIYSLALSYDNDEAFLNFRLGRIISNTFSGIGYIDGLLLQQNVSKAFRLGLFAGTQPQWQYARFQSSIQKYGAYINIRHGDYGARRYEGTLAAAGEYHGSTVSREFLYLQNTLNNPSWDLYQSAEIELNRDWRKAKTGSSISLSNLYLSVNYRILSQLSAGLSLDDRTNYYTYEIRSLADSLFDDAMRYGLRANINWRLSSHWSGFINGGLRKRETDSQNTYSYAAGLQKTNLSALRLYMNINASGFVNYYSDGYHGSLQVGKTFTRGHDLSWEYGNYSYLLRQGGGTRSNQWLRMNGSLLLFKGLYTTGQYEYCWGADMPGQRIFAEIGYRF